MSIFYQIRRLLLKYASAMLVWIYHLRKKKTSIIGEIFYEAYLMQQITRIRSQEVRMFKKGAVLPAGYGVGLSERIVEIPWALSRLRAGKRHMDAGSSLNFEQFIHTKPLISKKIYITNLNPERYSYWEHGVSYVYDDLRLPLFADNCFDSISCISTLEHVGMDNTSYTNKRAYQEKKVRDHLMAIKEFKRILTPGGTCLLTLPYGIHKDHGWLQVFNARMVSTIIRTFNPSEYELNYYRYTKNGWQIATEQECKNETYSSGYRAPDFCVGARAVVCMELVK